MISNHNNWLNKIVLTFSYQTKRQPEAPAQLKIDQNRPILVVSNLQELLDMNSIFVLLNDSE
ncbi:MAG: hypothetical protein DYH15_04040 [Nitrosomonas sp. PRO4]|nr:hypothetical protein [Nitrosomonas sp. PRO4]